MSSKAKIIRFPNDDNVVDEAVDLNVQGSAAIVSRQVESSLNNVPLNENLDEETALPAPSARLDQLNDIQLKIYAENHRLVRLIEGGLTPNQAIKRTGSERSRRSVQDIYDRYKKLGTDGLLDKRWTRKPAVKILTKEVSEIALAWYFEREAAGYRAVAELTAESCRQRGLPIPSESSVKKYLCGLSEGVKLARKGAYGLKVWQQKMASVVEQKKTSYSNQLWQGDGTPPRIWIRRKIKGSWEPATVYLSAFIDDYSRAIPGFIVSTKHYDAWTISILSRFSIMKKEDADWSVSGLPFQIESDQGADWISDHVQTNWRSLGVNALIDPAYYPNLKGKVERWFRHLDSNCLCKLPGHQDAVGTTLGAARKHVHELLTLEQLRSEITDWIVNVYHQKVHSQTGRKPIELWEETVHYRPVPNEDDLNILLLKYDKERTILNCGVRLVINKEKHRYWAPDFDGLSGRRVRVRYNPEDAEVIWLYCAETGVFLCEAWDMRAESPKFNFEDVKKSRREEKQYLRGLKVKTREYYKNVLANDRLVEQEKEWLPAREIAKELPAAPAVVDDNNADAVKDMMRRMRERNRRRD